MTEMHASYLKRPTGEEVWSLCARGYETVNAYTKENRLTRIAKPDNWRLDSDAAANDAAQRGEAARMLISGMELPEADEETAREQAEAQESTFKTMRNASMRSVASARSGITAVFPPGTCRTNDTRPSTRETVASQRSVWKGCPDPESVCSNVPACASGSHRLLRPHTTQSFAPRATNKLSGAAGANVYKRPESAQSWSARNLHNVTSPIATYLKTSPESAKPKPRPGLSSYCAALSTMNREMVRK
jgi:hypothetical protein